MLNAVLFILGGAINIYTVISAVRTFVLPRAITDNLTTFVFQVVRKFFDFVLKYLKTYKQKDNFLSFYAPLSLLVLPPTWFSILSIGYTLMFYATGIRDWEEAFTIAGSSLLTLGFAKGDLFIHTLLSFTAATIGLIMVTLLIAYLPTMYAAFSRREVVVNQLAIRANTPPSPVEMILRYHRLDSLHQFNDFWEVWETWFTELEEIHTSLSALVFFRSPIADQSWVNAAGTILDAAALRLSLLDIPGDQEYLKGKNANIPINMDAAITIRAGYIAMRRIEDIFDLTYNPNPSFPLNPISISRTEFDQAIKIFEDAGIPLREDKDKAWQDFAGWRVNYDASLIALQEFTNAPDSPWISPQTGEALG